MKHLKLFNSFVNEELNEVSSIDEAKQEHIKYLQDFITRWDDAQENDRDLKSLEAEYNKKLTQFGLPKMSADELLHQLQSNIKEGSSISKEMVKKLPSETQQRLIQNIKGNSSLSKITEGVVSIKGGRILAHKVLNKLVDMEIIPVKKKTEDLVEAIASLLATTSMSESVNEAFEVIYTNQNVRGSKKFNDRSKALAFAETLIAQGANEVDVFNAGGNFNSSADTDAVIAWYGNGTYMDNMSKKDPKLAAKKMDESEINEGTSTYVFHVYPRDEEGNHIPKKRFEVKIKRANVVSAKEALYKDYPTRFYFSELDSTINEGMVQVAGKNKPSGAKVLATIIVDDLMKKDYLKPGADKVKTYLVDDVQDVIMNNTF